MKQSSFLSAYAKDWYFEGNKQTIDTILTRTIASEDVYILEDVFLCIDAVCASVKVCIQYISVWVDAT